MKQKTLLIAFFCALLLFISFTDKANADFDGGWVICEAIRTGSNAMHGFAYLELSSAGSDDGIFTNTIFQIDESIRAEGLAVALTALSLGEYVRVYVSAEENSYGYQILKAVYTYVP